MSAREEVRAAAVYLDGIKPDWWRHVDARRLNMRLCRSCVAGQNDIDYEAASRAVGFTGCTDPGTGTIFGPFGDDRAYEPFWLEEMALRMPAAVPEQDRDPVTA